MMTPTMPGSGGGNASHTHPYSPGSLLVAASDAHITTRLSADYLCDGTADDVDLNAAIAAAGGGKVMLSEGLFTITGQMTPVSGVTGEGVGWSSVFQIADSSPSVDAVFEDATDGSASDWILRDIAIDGNKANVTTSCRGITVWGSHVLIENV